MTIDSFRRLSRGCFLFGFLFFFYLLPVRAGIQYKISISNPERHLFQVTMRIPDVSGSVTVQMPAWNALYQVRDFSAHVRQVEATASGKTLPVKKTDKQTWVVQGNGEIVVRYSTFWDEPGPFAAQLNAAHAFINPAMILMYVPKRRNESMEVVLEDIPEGWRAAGPTVKTVAETQSKISFSVRSYDELADSPIELGKFTRFAVPGLTPPVWVVVHGDNWKRSRIEAQLSKICRYELGLMGGAPYQEYTFIFHFGKDMGGGGMEHANATAISVPKEELFEGVSAHEFFHLWNVKRIRPASLDPVDYTKEQYTRSLWFAEGITDTYERFTLVRSGIWSKQDFYSDLAMSIFELENSPANRWQSAEQSSLDAWLEKYEVYDNPANSISYYRKGHILGVLLDLEIRRRTQNARSLDDVMRLMNERFAKKSKPYADSTDIRHSCEEVAGSSFEEFFESYVAGTKPFSYAELFAAAGLTLKLPGAPGERPLLSEVPNAGEIQKRIREGFLQGKTDSNISTTAH